MFSEILSVIRDIGPVSLTIAVLVYAFVRLLDTNSSDDKRYNALFDKHLALERKFTECREALANERGEKDLAKQARSYDIEQWLDETKDFDRELSMERARSAELTIQLREANETIASLQGLNSQLKAKNVANATPETNEQSKEFREDSE